MFDKNGATTAADCTMHIPISDRDYLCAKHVLPHQMRVLGKYAADVLITINRFESPQQPEVLDNFLSELASEYSNIRVEEVDYSHAATAWVSDTFFDGASYPFFDYDGIPIHAFLEPFRRSRHPYFFRLDSDMMLGGSGPWINEAIDVLKADKNAVVINPLAGPRNGGAYHSGGEIYNAPQGEAFKVKTLTTRTLLVELEAFLKAMSPLKDIPPKRMKDRLFARVAGYPVAAHLETIYQNKMLESNLYRVDMEGSTGLWTLHPTYKTPQFLQRLPDIIKRVESGDLPPAQLGQYDLQGSVFNQTDIPPRSAQTTRLLSLAQNRLSQRRSSSNLRFKAS